MRWRDAAITCAALALLAGCTTPATRPQPPAPVLPPPAPTTPAPPPAAPAAPPAAATTPDVWSRVRASFAMQDCVAPAVHEAQRETRHRRAFEARLQAILPMIDYIQRAAAGAHVAGEFVMLPWVESRFHETPPSHGRSAGMWQIMPITARATGLPTNRRYDGRLDKIASTRTVMRLLSGYYRQWHDWRMVDMAYNTGATRLGRILKAHGMPPAKPVIPTLPVGHTTHRHLIKLLAVACVIRDPARFDVRLPTWHPDDALQAVKLPTPAHLREVAHLAGLPLARVQQLNAGYRLGQVTGGTPMQVLLPVRAAQSLREAIAAGRLPAADTLASTHAAATYTVAAGDSLWGIAHRFHLDVSQLQQWNDLAGHVVRPGQVLQLEPSPAG